MVDQSALLHRSSIVQGLFQSIHCPAGDCKPICREGRTKSVLAERDTRQPTMRSANVSMTKATYTKPCHVDTYVKSLTYYPAVAACSDERAQEVRRRRSKLAVHLVTRTRGRGVWNRCFDHLASYSTKYADLLHQTLDRVIPKEISRKGAVRWGSAPLQSPRASTDATPCGPRRPDSFHPRPVGFRDEALCHADGASRPWRDRHDTPADGKKLTCYRQHPADRLDTVNNALIPNEANLSTAA